MQARPNHLIHENSPYLLQHAYNPVDWYPWGAQSLEKANKENKLILISIGYAACHWCHVMEKESFEDDGVASIMNEHFVCIKVDREERPDVDHIYMNALQLMTGSGGWPLNCIALPDQRPIYAGTYFKKDAWKEVLLGVSSFWESTPHEAYTYAEKLVSGLEGMEKITIPSETSRPSEHPLQGYYQSFMQYVDRKEGGLGNAPKFPCPTHWHFMMHYGHLTGTKDALNMAEVTLDKMAFGGIYDHIGGGFSRYSTDRIWKVPHFEKMLYDNAQLISLYSEAYTLFKKPLYKKTVYDTLQFIRNELSHPEGGYYASLDADSEGIEGEFYVWSNEALVAALGDHAAVFNRYFHVLPEGNWEMGKNILYRDKGADEMASRLGLSPSELSSLIEKCIRTLRVHRLSRVRPATDDKIIMSWNCLMMKGFLDAFVAFNDAAFLSEAIRQIRFIEAHFIKEGQVFRAYKNNVTKIHGFLDDYIFLCRVYSQLYECTFDEYWIHASKRWMEAIILNFFDPQSGFFYYDAPIGQPLIARKMEVHDHVVVSTNAETAWMLYRLGLFFEESRYLDMCTAMVSAMAEQWLSYPPSYSHWAALYTEMCYGTWQVTFSGAHQSVQKEAFDRQYIPNKIVFGGKGGALPAWQGKDVNAEKIYVCNADTCFDPVTTAEAAARQCLGNLSTSSAN